MSNSGLECIGSCLATLRRIPERITSGGFFQPMSSEEQRKVGQHQEAQSSQHHPGCSSDQGLEGGPLLFELLQVDRVCARLFTGINVPGKHTEMKHLVFKSVLGARQNEQPLIKARHVISTHVTQSRPRP